MSFLINALIIFFVLRWLLTRLLGVSASAASEKSFMESLLELIAQTMRTDGRVTRNELDVVKHILVQQYGEQKAREALLMLRDILKRDIDVDAACERIRVETDYGDKLIIIDILCKVIEADTIITASEVQEVCNMAYKIGLHYNDILVRIVQRLHVNGDDRDGSGTGTGGGESRGGYGGGYNSGGSHRGYNSGGSRGGYGGGSSSSTSNEPSLSQAYATLGVTAEATNGEVKEAYRSLVKQWHPDKFATATPQEQARAEERFKQVQAAYEKVKAARGL